MSRRHWSRNFLACIINGMASRVYYLDELDGHNFEEAIGFLFERLGFSVQRGKLSNDEGRDHIAVNSVDTIVIECKHHQGTIGRPVIQKLHSATLTYEGATRGLVITTSDFSDGAFEYADKLRMSSTPVDLWNYSALIQKAASVDVYFPRSRGDFSNYFWVPDRSASELRDSFLTTIIDSLKSIPRVPSDVVRITKLFAQVVPVISIQYELRKDFYTNVGLVHSAQAQGRSSRMAGTIELKKIEASVLNVSSTVRLNSLVNGKHAVEYFSTSDRDIERAVACDIAAANSRVVSYYGANNQRYQKECIILPADVRVNSTRTIALRKFIDFEFGERAYTVSLLDDRSQRIQLASGLGFDAGFASFEFGEGFLCNDCGNILPKSARKLTAVCCDCGRTLCRGHSFLAALPISWKNRRFCSDCFVAHASACPSPPEIMNEKVGLIGLSLIPALPQIVMGDWITAMAILAVALCTIWWPYALVLAYCGSLALTWRTKIRIKILDREIKRVDTYRPVGL